MDGLVVGVQAVSDCCRLIAVAMSSDLDQLCFVASTISTNRFNLRGSLEHHKLVLYQR